MKVTVEDYKGAKPNGHPLFESGRSPAQFAGHFLFVQVLTDLSESPVKLILHDRLTGVRKLLTVEQEAVDLEMKALEDAARAREKEVTPVVKKEVQRLVIKLPEKVAVKVPPKEVSPPVVVKKSPQIGSKSPALKVPLPKK